ncbi:DNA-3-methyladenine glycosylase II [Amorphus sp. MBR-141]
MKRTAAAAPPLPAAGLRPIETDADVAAGLQALVDLDPRLVPVRDLAGDLPLRLRQPGFEGLVRIIVSQQLSVASATAIWARLADGLGEITVEQMSARDDEALRAMGLSRPKVRALRAICEAVGGGLDLGGIAALPADEAHTMLCTVKGIGPWTADVYLLFCAGHPDIFPAGDIALQNAVADAFGLEARPSIPELHDIAAVWSPWRGVAARLFWAYYGARKAGREVLPV